MPTTYYIDPAGSDSNGGLSSGDPWLTPSKFITTGTSGDTLICAAGTYTSGLGPFTSVIGRTIQGAPLVNNMPTTIFDHNSNWYYWLFSGTNQFDRITWKNQIANATNQGTFMACSSGATANITCNNCTYQDFESAGGAANWIQEEGSFSNRTTQGGAGVVNFDFNQCLFYDFKNRSGSNTGKIFNNSSLGGTGSTFDLNSSTIYLKETTDPLTTIMVQSSGLTGINFNGIIIQNDGTSMAVYTTVGGTTPPIVTNSCIYDNGNLTNIPSGTDSITTNPEFVNTNKLNFNLTIGSPARNTGIIV
jgi:hypothetical protein